jgi:hypothetical protein
MDTISIRNWSKYQHYTDRNPPWIKLYHSLLDDYEYSCLQDASKLLLMSLYLLASRTGNKIPADSEWIRQKAMIKTKIDLAPLATAGFIEINSNGNQDASVMLASCKQNGVSETETETETETEKRQRRKQTYRAVALPDWLEPELWKDFQEHRKKLRKPMTLRAEEMIIKKLAWLKEKDYNPRHLLLTAIERGWLSVFEPKENA